MICRVSLAILLAAFATSPTLAQTAEWKPLLGDLLKTEKPGFGGLCGVAGNRETGAVFVNISDRGFYRMREKPAGRWTPHPNMSIGAPSTGRMSSPACPHAQA